MDTSHAAWYRATTLAERVRAGRGGSWDLRSEAVDLRAAEERFERWRSEAAFVRDGSRFEERLAADGISEGELLWLLSEPAEALRDRLPGPMPWLEDLVRAFREPRCPRAAFQTEQSQDEELLYVAEPLVRHGRERLSRGIRKLLIDASTPPFDPDRLERLLFPSLSEQLLARVSRTLVLELNVAGLQGLLSGQSPEERFRSFVACLRHGDTALEILRRYPVLARQLVECVDRWVRTSLEFTRRLLQDWDDIRRVFCRADPGDLDHIRVGAGDPHRGGRSVFIVTFDSGFKIVYKPRSLRVDVHFQDLLAWLNERGQDPPFRRLRVLDRTDHAWVEYLEPSRCTSVEQVRRFYLRQGGYLALLYALNATDLHSGNLVAVGEHPMLIDLEALFHPPVALGGASAPVAQLADGVLRSSVLAVGLLPHRIYDRDETSEGVDISGLGAAPGQMSLSRVPSWEGAGTDKMRLVRRRVRMPEDANRPTLGDAEVDAFRHVEDVISGFRNVYGLMLSHRDHLLSDEGPLARFADDEVRYIARPTQTYAALLSESFHPDLLRDALRRDRFFDNLWSNFEPGSGLKRLFLYEREDLHRGDVPMFTTRPASRDLWSSSGDRIEDYFRSTGLELSYRRILQLDAEDLERQVWFIRASFTALIMGEGLDHRPRFAAPTPLAEASRGQLLAAARAAGDRLEFLALQGEGGVGWVGPRLVDGHVWSLDVSGSDLYDGLPGIALFLGYLGVLTGEERYTTLAERAIATVLRGWERAREQSRSSLDHEGPEFARSTIGAFGELGGTIYALTHLGVLWDRSRLLDEAEKLAEMGCPLLEKDDRFDMVGGAAGFLSVLLSLYAWRPSHRLLHVASRCGDHLLANSQPADRGIGWRTPMNARPLTGFAHGAAGVAVALLELAAATRRERFRKTAHEAFEYERGVFSAEVGNWPDLREYGQRGRSAPGEQPGRGAENFQTAWCYGAPGIGLSRLRALRHADDPQLRAEVEVAVETTSREIVGVNHSLCHGAMGNLDLLVEAGRLFGDTRLLSRAYTLAAGVLLSIGEHGWLCGVPEGVETPGLMVGIAGIGFGALRLAEPARVPSVLALRPPVACGDL